MPEDKNENWDVYEYNIETGRQRLLSTGRGEKPEVFAEASADGSTVWFATKTPVLAKDPDKLRDLYASRIGGGFVEPPPSDPLRRGRLPGPDSAAPNDPSPATPRFSGPGNPKPHHKRHHLGRRSTTRGTTEEAASEPAPNEHAHPSTEATHKEQAMTSGPRRLFPWLVAVIAAVALLGPGAAGASAAPVFELHVDGPEAFLPEEPIAFETTAENTGDAPLWARSR